MSRTLLLVLFFILTPLIGCSGDDNASPAPDAGVEADSGEDLVFSDEGTSVRFKLEGEFFDTPLPSDTRLAEDGSFELAGWEAAYENTLLELWFDAVVDLVRGWGLVSGVFMWFEEAIDPDSLPQSVEESTDTSDGFPSVALVDVDPDSAERGRIMPLFCRFTEAAGTHHPANQLGCYSPFGVVRRPETTYAFVVTRSVTDAAGDPVAPSAEMAALLAGVDVLGTSSEPFTAAVGELEELGLSPDDIAHVTILTTGDPTARLRQVNAFYDGLPEPTRDEAIPYEIVEEYDDYLVVAGYYDVPNIQNGTKPYTSPPDGKIAFDADGNIELVEMESIRFILTIPTTTMPSGGWPMMIYMHGSGGQGQELVDRGERTMAEVPAPAGSGPAMTLATYGWAGFAADFPFHDTRFSPPDTTGLKLYNLLGNPRATIDNFIVSANEVTFHARLLDGLTVDPSIDSQGRLDAGDAPDGLIRFNMDQIGAMGQSMGSTLGIPAATVDENIDALIPSGAGGVLVEIASTSTKPFTLATILKGLLRFRPDETIDQYNILLHTIQQVWDFVDPVVHSRHVFAEPHGETPPKHVYMSAGLGDGYFSPEAQAGVTAGMGLELVGPVLESRILLAMTYEGVGETESFPLSANGPGGVTAAVTQHEPSVLDGHNVTFQRDDVKAIYGCFLKTLASGSPEVRAPEDATLQNCP